MGSVRVTYVDGGLIQKRPARDNLEMVGGKE
jgi:hypothetical protein